MSRNPVLSAQPESGGRNAQRWVTCVGPYRRGGRARAAWRIGGYATLVAILRLIRSSASSRKPSDSICNGAFNTLK